MMIRKRHIVILDDEPNIGLSLRLILEGEGYRVTICHSTARFQAERGKGRADLYLLDLRLPDGNGVDVLRSLRQADDSTPAVMISGHGTIRDAVDAMAEKARAAGYLVWEPRQEPYPVGYYCGVRDPDGNMVEFSYGQPLGPGALD